MSTNYRRERHSVTDLYIHLVCITQYRRKVITADGLLNIEKSFRSVAEKMDFQIIEFNGEADHVHALIEYPPKLAVSKIVNQLKGVSSRMYRKEGFECPSEKAMWSPSYFAASAGGAPIEVLKQYVKSQDAP